jgi:hypothetical protein
MCLGRKQRAKEPAWNLRLREQREAEGSTRIERRNPVRKILIISIEDAAHVLATHLDGPSDIPAVYVEKLSGTRDSAAFRTAACCE